jgi:DNA helicase-2/ATP-dependent DNA helicase PcrA
MDDSDAVSDDELTLRTLKETFERSAWASRRPAAIELEINVPFAGNIFICKIDAIYEIEGSSPQRFEIVDWKTGRPPSDKKDLELKQLQLALYRMAYATWAGIPEEHIDAVFYFVADDVIIRPERLYSESELEERWLSLTGGIPL